MLKDIIMIVDDEPSVLSSLYRSLRSEPWEVLTELSGEQALVRMRDQPIKVVISDERMAKMQGAEFLTIVRTLYPQTVRILLTGQASLEAAIEVINSAEVFRFLTKPWDIDMLKEHIRKAIQKYDRDQKILDIIKRCGDNPGLVPHIEKKFPGISQVIENNYPEFSHPDLSDADLEDIWHFMDSDDIRR